MSNKHHPQPVDPQKISELLARASSDLDDNTLAALRRARNLALEHQTSREPALALPAGHGLHWLVPHTPHQWAATAILLIAILVGGVGYWHHATELELSHLDVAILTDELPMEIFVD